MANKTNYNSHTKKTLCDLVEQIPVFGPPLYKLYKRRGGAMKKIGAYSLILVALIVFVIAFLLWLHYENGGQQTTSHNKTATTAGSNSPATLGNNNALIQNSPNATLNYGLTDDMYKHIREDMEAVQKLKDAQLRAEFNIGYILFTTTERNEIVPLKSPMDDIITIDWKSGYHVSSSGDTVQLRFPNIILHPSEVEFNGCTATLPKHENVTFKAIANNDTGIVFKVISVNKDSMIIAMGIKSPP